MYFDTLLSLAWKLSIEISCKARKSCPFPSSVSTLLSFASSVFGAAACKFVGETSNWKIIIGRWPWLVNRPCSGKGPRLFLNFEQQRHHCLAGSLCRCRWFQKIEQQSRWSAQFFQNTFRYSALGGAISQLLFYRPNCCFDPIYWTNQKCRPKRPNEPRLLSINKVRGRQWRTTIPSMS